MVEKLPIPVAETIRKRRSVRTYEERPLSPEDRAKLVGYMGAVGNPFGVEVRLHIADRSVAAGGETLGTYGIIKGAGTFLGVSVPDTEPAPLAAGYQFECLVLCATAMASARSGWRRPSTGRASPPPWASGPTSSSPPSRPWATRPRGPGRPKLSCARP